jgi:hypothetical protein
MISSPRISVIVPCNHSQYDLLKIVHSLCCQSILPAEIIVVDSSDNGCECPTGLVVMCASKGIELFYAYCAHAMPGHARNIGLDIASAELIAFIDVQTIPRQRWLEASLTLLEDTEVMGVFGGTTFIAKSWFEKLVRDAFYGISPRKTLPGSVFRREVFVKTGQLINWVRAGEDTEWMLRVDVLKIPVAYPLFGLVDYVGLIGMDLKTMLKKWHRNYSASHYLPHLFPQKLFLWMVLYPLIIFVGFNWNYLFANWHEDSPLYIAHITKMAAVFPIFAYLVTRGILLPLRRGVGFNQLFPIRFLQIAGICFMADAVKAFVFSIPKGKFD